MGMCRDTKSRNELCTSRLQNVVHLASTGAVELQLPSELTLAGFPTSAVGEVPRHCQCTHFVQAIFKMLTVFADRVCTVLGSAPYDCPTLKSGWRPYSNTPNSQSQRARVAFDTCQNLSGACTTGVPHVLPFLVGMTRHKIHVESTFAITRSFQHTDRVAISADASPQDTFNSTETGQQHRAIRLQNIPS